MDAESRAVRFAPKRADVLQARSLGASWLTLLPPIDFRARFLQMYTDNLELGRVSARRVSVFIL
ncbi:hypothetical protein Slip_1036 [Syntrophothermus lipocalidus DSM 12680]|uniref:Uncharacterized protein n=1 Tax=Syntrophothermus lipocalidus (strain DSM 12680 / TGB-C1) TaxID=643648 RepID=D7CM80_SYNLT|nr:hypothetical protein Slip_1036 [Syntrophothermus lipocalidus DSM 12680]